MKRLILALLMAVFLAACGDSASPTTDSATTDSPTTEASAPATTAPETASGGGSIQVASSDLGEILTDAEGRTLYLFTPDEQGDSTCYDDCATNWPAFTESASAGDGVDGSLLGSVTRTDGTEQVTYNGWPLYYFIGDQAPGDTNGQSLNDIWWVVDPAGEAISG